MNKQKAKFELIERLKFLGFTYEEAVSLRRIEMTLRGWATAECNGEIERDEKTGKPVRHNSYSGSRDQGYPIADREAGALRRLKAIVAARNQRKIATDFRINGILTQNPNAPDFIVPYHQTDPRGCSLYLCTREQIGDSDINSTYSRGLAVCA